MRHFPSDELHFPPLSFVPRIVERARYLSTDPPGIYPGKSDGTAVKRNFNGAIPQGEGGGAGGKNATQKNNEGNARERFACI